MVLINNLVYETNLKKIEKEEQVIELLNEVNHDVASFLNVVGLDSLKGVLKVVEEGVYESKRNEKPSGPKITYRIDLSQAKALINQYRSLSEGGCQSCEEYGHNKPLLDENIFYCKLDEQEALNREELNFGDSPKISKFYKKGCEDRKPIFSRTIEQILEKN